MKNILLGFALMLCVSVSFADVHKWKDADGKVHYGDAPPMAGTQKVKTDTQTEDQIENGHRIQAETASFVKKEESQKLAEATELARQQKKEAKRQDCLNRIRNLNKAFGVDQDKNISGRCEDN